MKWSTQLCFNLNFGRERRLNGPYILCFTKMEGTFYSELELKLQHLPRKLPTFTHTIFIICVNWDLKSNFITRISEISEKYDQHFMIPSSWLKQLIFLNKMESAGMLHKINGEKTVSYTNESRESINCVCQCMEFTEPNITIIDLNFQQKYPLSQTNTSAYVNIYVWRINYAWAIILCRIAKRCINWPPCSGYGCWNIYIYILWPTERSIFRVLLKTIMTVEVFKGSLAAFQYKKKIFVFY